MKQLGAFVTCRPKPGRLVVAAIFAIGLLVAPVSDAAEFHSETAPTFFRGEQVTETIFTLPFGSWKCKQTTLVGEMKEKLAKELTLSPTYSECKVFGGNTPVTMNGCDYLYRQPTGKGTPGEPYDGKTKIVCPEGNDVVIHVPVFSCSITLEANQEPEGVIDYTDEGTGANRDLRLTSTLSGVRYRSIGPSSACGKVGEPRSDFQISGSITLKGYANAALTVQSGIFVE
jgi:hypothetical protein